MNSNEILKKYNLRIIKNTDDCILIANDCKSMNTCINFCNYKTSKCILECIFYFDEGIDFKDYLDAIKKKVNEMDLRPVNKKLLYLENKTSDEIFEKYNLKIQEETNESISIYGYDKGIYSYVDFVKTRTVRHKTANALEFSFHFNEDINFDEFLEAIRKKAKELDLK